METREILIAARAIITEPEHWTQGHSARTASGDPITIGDPIAYAFCASGAIWRSLDNDVADSKLHSAFGALNECLPAGFESVVDYNDADATRHADVIALFNRAIDAYTDSRMD